MDDLGWSWPAWKFGMKREDLTTKLHNQYNTFPSAIQDPEAFHHDVFEAATTASDTDEFHTLLASRKQQRLQELNESLESAAFEIIAHPRLVGTEQWQYALQLFRTRSLDSLVRYFSSYLPESYLDCSRRCGAHTPLSAASSFADDSSVATASTDASSVDADNNDDDDSHDHVPTFLSRSSGKAAFTQEPEDIPASFVSRIDTHLPPTPQSVIIDSDSYSDSDADTAASSPAHTQPHHSELHRPISSRTTSFSSSCDESAMDSVSRSIHNLESYHSIEDDINSPATSDADLSDSRSSVDSITFSESESGSRHSHVFPDEDEEDECFQATQLPMDDEMFDMYPHEEDAPLSRFSNDIYDVSNPETHMPNAQLRFPIMDPKSSTSLNCERSTRSKPSKESRDYREESSLRCNRRTPEESDSRIQKPTPGSRPRPRGRRMARLEYL